jgi:hypothetical protein
MTKTIIPLTLFSVLCLSFSGCGNKSNLDGLVPCGGKVTFNGEACNNARISFSPTGNDMKKRRASGGTTDSSGTFKMTTLQPGDGVYPGDYEVTITKELYSKVVYELKKQRGYWKMVK